jgi:hypothetical protein
VDYWAARHNIWAAKAMKKACQKKITKKNHAGKNNQEISDEK